MPVRKFEEFISDRLGATAVLFALLAIPLLLVMGLSVDYARSEQFRLANQAALDNAVISALSKSGDSASVEDVQSFFQANGGTGTITNVGKTQTEAALSMTAAATFKMPLGLGRLAHAATWDINVAAEASAPRQITEMKIEPLSASGWWIKTMSLYATFASDPATPVLLGQVFYRPSTPFSSTGTVTDTFGGNPVSIKGAVKVWFAMDISPLSMGLFPGTKLHLSTDDPETSYFLYVDGRQMPQSIPVNLAEAVPCGQEVTHSWEDGGDFSAQDFFYKVVGRCETSAGGVAHLTK